MVLYNISSDSLQVSASLITSTPEEMALESTSLPMVFSHHVIQEKWSHKTAAGH